MTSSLRALEVDSELVVAPYLTHIATHHGQQTGTSSTAQGQRPRTEKPKRGGSNNRTGESDRGLRFNVGPAPKAKRQRTRAAVAETTGESETRARQQQEESDGGAFGADNDSEIPDYPPPTFEDAISTTTVSQWVPQPTPSTWASRPFLLGRTPSIAPVAHPHTSSIAEPSPEPGASKPARQYLSIFAEPSASPQISPITPSTALPSPSPTTSASSEVHIISIEPSSFPNSDSLEIFAPSDVAQCQWEDPRDGLTLEAHTKREWERHLATRTEFTLGQEIQEPQTFPTRFNPQAALHNPIVTDSQVGSSSSVPRRVPASWRQTLDEPAMHTATSTSGLPGHARTLSVLARITNSGQTSRTEVPTSKNRRRLFSRGKGKDKVRSSSNGSLGKEDGEPLDSWEVIPEKLVPIISPAHRELAPETEEPQPPKSGPSSTPSTPFSGSPLIQPLPQIQAESFARPPIRSSPDVKRPAPLPPPMPTVPPYVPLSGAFSPADNHSPTSGLTPTMSHHSPSRMKRTPPPLLPRRGSSNTAKESPTSSPQAVPANVPAKVTPPSIDYIHLPLIPSKLAFSTPAKPDQTFGRDVIAEPSSIDQSTSSMPDHEPSALEGIANALVQLNTNISPWVSPSHWNNDNTAHVLALLEEAVVMTGNEGEFENTLDEWRTWDDIMVFERHQQIKSYFQEKFVILSDDVKLSTVKSKEIFQALLALDVVALSAQLTDVLMDNTRYKKLLACHGDSAQAVLNLLQARLDYPIESGFKPRHIKALIKLSERSGQYPECLLLRDTTLPQYAVAGGSFGDVYKAKLAGNDIAVKVIKIYQKSNMDKVLKALDVANGLEYLHAEHVVHADLKCANILVSQARRACLADFGLARPRESLSVQFTSSSTRVAGGTLNWTAPELLPDMTKPESSSYEMKQPDSACDVYSFAMVCYEVSVQSLYSSARQLKCKKIMVLLSLKMFSGCIPFYGKREPQVIYAIGFGKRPDRPSGQCARTRGLTDPVWDIIIKCWEQQPSLRLSAAQAAQQLRDLPNRPVDDRPLDKYDIPPPSRQMYKQAQHPFSILETIAEQVTGNAVPDATVNSKPSPSMLALRSPSSESNIVESPDLGWSSLLNEEHDGEIEHDVENIYGPANPRTRRAGSDVHTQSPMPSPQVALSISAPVQPKTSQISQPSPPMPSTSTPITPPISSAMRSSKLPASPFSHYSGRTLPLPPNVVGARPMSPSFSRQTFSTPSAEPIALTGYGNDNAKRSNIPEAMLINFGTETDSHATVSDCSRLGHGSVTALDNDKAQWVSATSRGLHSESVNESAAGANAPIIATPPAPPALSLYSEITDLDLLISRMQNGPSDRTDYDALLMAQQVVATPEHPHRIDSTQPISPTTLLGRVEVERWHEDGHEQSQLSLLGAPVTKCSICLAQFRSTELGALSKNCHHW
ncbi:hypothetical protein HWV62_23518 [Athelia sp. TMB]|nr:hypothetical protein HWV62_23518 [Athelia sp. TMB]